MTHIASEPTDTSLDVEAGGWFFANSLDLFVIMRDAAIARVNPAFTLATGWTTEEVVGRPLRDVVPAEDMELVRLGAAKLFAEGHAACEHRLLKRDGGELSSRARRPRPFRGAL